LVVSRNTRCNVHPSHTPRGHPVKKLLVLLVLVVIGVAVAKKLREAT
jgi:hypothetical protein